MRILSSIARGKSTLLLYFFLKFHLTILRHLFALSHKLNYNTNNQLPHVLTPNSSSNIITQTDRQLNTKRRSSDTSLRVTKIPPTKKSNIRDAPVESFITMIPRSVPPPKKEVTESRRRSLSPRASSATNSHLSQMGHRTRHKEQNHSL